jgi:hypothetical protein
VSRVSDQERGRLRTQAAGLEWRLCTHRPNILYPRTQKTVTLDSGQGQVENKLVKCTRRQKDISLKEPTKRSDRTKNLMSFTRPRTAMTHHYDHLCGLILRLRFLLYWVQKTVCDHCWTTVMRMTLVSVPLLLGADSSRVKH